MRRSTRNTFNDTDDEFNDDSLNTEDSLSNDMYEADIYDDEEFLDDFDREKDLEAELKEEKKNRKKEFYVKGADLKAELQKYHDSKKTSPDGKRNYF